MLIGVNDVAGPTFGLILYRGGELIPILYSEEFEIEKVGAWLRRAIEIARIAEAAFVEIFLECPGEVGHSHAHLHLQFARKRDGVGGFESEFEKRRAVIEYVALGVIVFVAIGNVLG